MPRRFYSTEFIKAYAHRQRKNKEELKEFKKGTLKIPGTFNLDSVVQVSKTGHEGELITLVHSLKKGNKELMTQVSLRENSLIHVSESYTSQIYWNPEVNQQSVSNQSS